MANRLTSVDSVSLQLPEDVREKIAENLTDPATVEGAALSATFAPYHPIGFAATTAYKAGQIVINPAGDAVVANVDFTSGASYNASDWTAYTPPASLPPQIDFPGVVQVPGTFAVSGEAYVRRLRIRNVDSTTGLPRADQAGLMVTDVSTDGYDKSRRLALIHSKRTLTQPGGLLLVAVEQEGNSSTIDVIGMEAEAGTADVSNAAGRRLIGVNGIARHRSNTTIGTAIGVSAAIQTDDASAVFTEASSFRALLPAKFNGTGGSITSYHGVYVAGSGDLIGDSSTTMVTPTNWYGLTSKRPPTVAGDKLAALLEGTTRIKPAATTDTALEVLVDGDATPRLRVYGSGAIQSPDTDQVLIPASRFTISQGAPALSSRNGIPIWQMDQSSDERVSAQVVLPSHWVTFAVDVAWAHTGAGSGDVRWRWDEQFLGDGDSLNMVSQTATVATAPATDVLEVTTIATGRPVTGGKVLQFGIARSASNVADTLAEDAALVSVTLRRVS